MKKMLVIAATAIFLFSLSACQKKEEQPAEQESTAPSGPIIDSPSSLPGHGASEQKTTFQVVVPPDVEAAWSKIILIVEDKKENKKQEFTLKIGDELKLPDSNLIVRIGPFLPDFKMDSTVITSASNEAVNPALGIAVFEDGNKLFPVSGEWGWLYTKFPDIHSFQHERFALALKEGIKK